MNYAFYTLGCKVNQYETNSMEALVKSKGHFVVPADCNADVIVINSCTVTAESDRKTRQIVRRLKSKSPHAVCVLTGCMPQALPEKALKVSDADIIMGNRNLACLCEFVDEFLKSGQRVIKIAEHESDEKFNTPTISQFNERTRAYLKIQDGCQRHCTYCIIPKARGRVRSKSIEEIKSEVSLLAKNGHKEIVLVGINLSAFGSDTGFNLCDAVDAVCEIDGVERVRLGSLEPDLFTDSMLLRLKSQVKLCPQFHLSLQSGCDETLKRMNRHYDSAFYEDLVERIRATFDNAAITTDIMVGFAGETEEEFLKSLNFVKKIKFAKSHIFAYSQREGTFADKMPNQVQKSEKERRSKLMIDAAKQSEAEFLKSQTGKTVNVLFEQQKGEYCYGYSENYTLIKVKANDIVHKILKVKITQAEDECCIGEIIKEAV